jgi:short-subunit dehydrogenase
VRILIVGATSAIAAATARRLAARGDTLYLIARNVDRLAALVAELGSAVVGHACFDILDDAHDALLAAAQTAMGTIEVALLAHGLLGDQLRSEQDATYAERILQTNLNGTIGLLIPLANLLEAQGHGTLAVITSVAADRGRPRNYTYGAAKGALNVYLQGLRTRLGPTFRVITLKVGPTHSPMTDGHGKHALFAQPDEVAAGIVRALGRRGGVRYVPARWWWIMGVVRRVPEPVFRRVPFLGGR